MFEALISRIKSIFKTLAAALQWSNSQPAYEIKNISISPETSKHIIEMKLIGKAQSITCTAEDIAGDNNFIMRFSPADIRTITYYATADRYELMLNQVNNSRSYEIIRSKNINGNKTVQLRNKLTNENIIMPLKEFSKSDLIDELNSEDVYYLGYLSGQEQALRDYSRMKLITTFNHDSDELP